ncbi:hypothetical protein [Flavihumibacter sp.]|uniref:hypothetical protein n=1 Tax=Flavihumibacter sp. TaxID=1913981 RepID=UPI002FCC5511
MDSLVVCIRDGKLEKAAQNQDVIGNNYDGDFEIGMAQNDNSYTGTATDYQPVDGFKRTITGLLERMKYMGGGLFDKDDDINFIIKAKPDNELLAAHKDNLMRANYPADNRPWNLIFGEIDIHEESHKFYKSPYPMPIPMQDSVSLYGPWVLELYDEDEGRFGKFHQNYHEIHPSEQIWWVNKRGRNRTIYMIMAADNSGRYNGRKDYTEYGNTKLVNLWQNSPFEAVFALPLKMNMKTESIVFEITEVAQKNVKRPSELPKNHFLVYKKDTLAQVILPNNSPCSISFENIGYDPHSYWSDTNTTVVNGFLVIRATIHSPNDYAGNLRLTVQEKRKAKMYKISTGLR